ncbi:MAG TPA: hypothetical protein VH682_02645, partial [Gemmataceae bacterium]
AELLRYRVGEDSLAIIITGSSAERVLPWALFEPHEPEQAESAETMIAAAQRPGGFDVVVLRALSAWPT